MNIVYNIFVFIASSLLNVAANFNKKLKLFVEGRKQSLTKINAIIKPSDKTIWIHCASLGEFEQGRPIIEKLKLDFPHHKLVLTFFSPSGYEVRKNYNKVDLVCYLPLDSKKNVKQFLDATHPELAIFVKYEFWPNLLKELKVRNIGTILISGIFRKDQAFFKWYGTWFRRILKTFAHFFVQDKNSKKLLISAGFNNVTVAGDTRFDRVFEITQQNNKLSFMDEFTNSKPTLVAGSTWKDDENVLVNYINKPHKNKVVIAPHNIHAEEIQRLKSSIQKKTVLYSEMEGENLQDYDVLIVDTIGILTKVYSYAYVAYVGGGYTKSGVHNVLEPATFGVPIIIGPNYKKFNEAKELVEKKGCFVVDDSQKLSVLLDEFFNVEENQKLAGENALAYVKNKTGATSKILMYLKNERKIR